VPNSHEEKARPPAPLGPLDPFAVPYFGLVWSTSLLSNIGTLVQATAAAWLMTTLTSSTQLVALVQTAVTLPVVLFALPVGVMADMFDRRNLLLAALVFMLAASAALAACVLAGAITPTILLALVFLVGCGTALYAPAWQASIRDIVPTHQVPAAVGLNSLAFNFARTAGPALGGALVSALGAAAAFVANAVTYLFLIAAIYVWRPIKHAQAPVRLDLAAALGDGIRYMAAAPTSRRMLIRVAAFGAASMAAPALAPLIVRDLLRADVGVYGFLLAAFGVGAMLGSFACVSLRQRWSTDFIVRAASLASGVGAIGMGLSDQLTWTLAAFALSGAAWAIALPSINVSLQLAAPTWLVGRVMGIYQMCLYGSGAFAGWVWGEAAAYLGLGAALVLSGVAQLPNLLMGERVQT